MRMIIDFYYRNHHFAGKLNTRIIRVAGNSGTGKTYFIKSLEAAQKSDSVVGSSVTEGGLQESP
jgi:type II secretory pathway predicted ATPase ExeA